MPWSDWTAGKRARAVAGVIAGLTTVGAAWIGAIPVVVEWSTGFDPEISVGSIGIAKAPTKTADNKVALYLNVKVDNAGDNAGCLSDFAIRLQNRAGSEETNWFFPVFLVDIKKLVELSNVGVDTSASISGIFSPLYLSAFSSLEREIAFMHSPNNNTSKDIMTVENLKPGLYQVEVFASAGELPCIKTAEYEPVFDDSVSFDISEKLIGYIKTGRFVSPGSTNLDRARKRLMQLK